MQSNKIQQLLKAMVSSEASLGLACQMFIVACCFGALLRQVAYSLAIGSITLTGQWFDAKVLLPFLKTGVNCKVFHAASMPLIMTLWRNNVIIPCMQVLDELHSEDTWSEQLVALWLSRCKLERKVSGLGLGWIWYPVEYLPVAQTCICSTISSCWWSRLLLLFVCC